MDVAAMVASVAVVTEILKKLLLKVRIEVKGQAAVILAGVVSVGVVLVAATKAGLPIDFSLLPVLIQVILASTIGYSIVTKKTG